MDVGGWCALFFYSRNEPTVLYGRVSAIACFGSQLLFLFNSFSVYDVAAAVKKGINEPPPPPPMRRS